MKRSVAVFALLAAPFGALAQSSQELEGLRHFNQSCRVCHAHAALKAPQYGPLLSRVSLGGDAQALRTVIANGTPRMPGFRYTFEPSEIDSIVAYLKSVPQPSD
ncbi:MAG TPA: cytochrome c [Burkholderiales bacterium]|nr:cytochrome c [Burkholderiales bacterium]